MAGEKPQQASTQTSRSPSVSGTRPPSRAGFVPANLTQNDSNFDPSIGAKPSSPFYRHATPSKLARFTSTRKGSRNHSTTDVENPASTWHRLFDDEALNRHESKLWKPKKSWWACDCFGGLSKGQRLVLKIASAVVIVGSMIAVALGITAAVGGGVWRG